jgi:SLOG in TRPM, prokaryote
VAHGTGAATGGRVGGHIAGEAAPRLARVARPADIPAALDEVDVPRPRPVLVLVGGAGGMDEATQQVLARVLRDAVLPVVERHGAAVVDGGTDSGVMRMLGRARAERNGVFPLVGVAASGTVRVPGGPTIDDAAEPERHHSHLVLVPGEAWGDESSWLTDVADVIAGECASVTVVVNGGEITYADAKGSLDRGRPVVVLAGTGRTADAIADARAGRPADPRDAAIAASPLTRVVAVEDAAAVRATIDALLSQA